MFELDMRRWVAGCPVRLRRAGRAAAPGMPAAAAADHTRPAAAVVLSALFLISSGTLPAHAASLPRDGVIAPGVRAALVSAGGAAIPVWVEFRDKGETGPADLAAKLAAAEGRLAPRNRARRLRARATPLVDLRDLPVHAPYLDALRGIGLEPYGVSRWFNHAAVRANAAALARLEALPMVRRVGMVERARLSPLPAPVGVMPPRDPATPFAAGRAPSAIDYGQTAGFVNQIRADAAHDSGYIGTGVLICVLDSGFNGWNAHEALAGIEVPADHVRDFVGGDFDVTGGFGFDHGGWVLGCMAGNRPGGYVGTAPGAAFALARSENGSSESEVEMVYWAQAAEWADSLGADVINSSLGYSRFDNASENITLSELDGRTSIVSRAAQIAASKGILVVNSAGNEGNDASWRKITAPADVHGDSLIAVGAVDLAGVRESFSSIGPTADGRIKPDLMANGASVPLISTTNPVGYTSGGGTSFASPIVAGLAACMLQARPAWTAVEVIRALRETANRWLSPDTLHGYGIPDGAAALRWPASVATVPPPLGLPKIALIGPNPLRSDGPVTRVRFALHENAEAPESGAVRVQDAQGRVVRELWSGVLARGEWVTTSWDGRTAGGARAGAGIYFIALDVAGYQSAVRVAWLH